MSDDGYLLANRQVQAGARFAALATLFDPVTFRWLAATGVGPGWRCWEVGAGGSSVPDWLADRVGPDGLVLATDLDLTWLPGHARQPAGPAPRQPDAAPARPAPRQPDAAPARPAPRQPDGAASDRGPLRVLRHDVGRDDPPATGLDLVHARLVLTHVPDRESAISALVSALRPGGWLVLEDADPALQPLLCPEDDGPEQRLANRLRRGFRTLLAGRDADLAFGRTLPRRLREHGLLDVTAEAHFPISSPAATALEIATVEQIRDRLVAAGIATPADIERHLTNLIAGRLPDLATAPMITASGRTPPAPTRER